MSFFSLYNSNNLEIWKEFLNFVNDNLWEEIYVDDGFIEMCEEFYFDKTTSRLKLFLKMWR